MRILGITGGIATGKSTVTELFAQLGAPVVSADQIAHDLLRPGQELSAAVLAEFPESRDLESNEPSTIDRRALGRLIFEDAAARARLEAITHPAIITRLKTEIERLRGEDQTRAAAAEIPLLFEAGLTGLVDSVIVVACSEELQVERLCRRAAIAPDEARRQIAAQWPLSEKIAKADFVINNNDAESDLKPHVEEIWDHIASNP